MAWPIIAGAAVALASQFGTGIARARATRRLQRRQKKYLKLVKQQDLAELGRRESELQRDFQIKEQQLKQSMASRGIGFSSISEQKGAYLADVKQKALERLAAQRKR